MPKVIEFIRAQSDQIRNWLEGCLHCGGISNRNSLYCETCWARIKIHEQANYVPQTWGYPFPIFALYQWHQGQGFEIHDLIHHLKGGRRGPAFNRVASRLSSALPLRGAPRLLVPCPAKRGPDHSSALANGLSRHLGAEVLDCLELEHQVSQKTQGALNRRTRRMRLKPKGATLPRPNSKAIITFVDDVVTTGATAQAGWSALGRPALFEVICVACRPRYKLL